MPHLEQWAVIEKLGPYQAPEQAKLVLVGTVSGHSRPDIPDGANVTTSRIVSVMGQSVITASGTAYTLGEPEAEYEAAFPGARDRIFAEAIH